MTSALHNNTLTIGILQRFLENGYGNLDFMDYVLLGCVILLGLETLNSLAIYVGKLMKSERIPVRGKHLDDLEQRDILFITLNKLATPPFVYFVFKYLHSDPNVIWSIHKLSFTNSILPIPIIIFIYDFFYTLLHWALHIQSVYGYIHKHHHRQKAPSRANTDAVNVHPIEFFLGEYNHILAMYIYTHILGQSFHVLSTLSFFILAALLTAWNHTRYNVTLRILGITIFDSKYHDVHHRIPQSNYGQYTLFWDHIFGSFRDYNENDRVNPTAQLDPKTGKSLTYYDRMCYGVDIGKEE